ncbi:Centromere/kinetochore protein zw10, partial [Coemansia sp. RSA 2052]
MRTLHDKRDTFARAVAEADRAQEAIGELLRGVDDMQALLGDERSGIHARLADAAESEARLRNQLRENGAALACMRLLARLNADLRSMDALIREGRLERASEMVLAVERVLSDAAIIHDTRIFGELRSRVDLAKENIRHNATAALQGLLVIRVDDSLAQLIAPADSLQKRQERYDSTRSLLAVLDMLGVQGKALAAYGAHFVKEFIRPVLATPVITQVSYFANEGTQLFGVQRSNLSSRVTEPAAVCAIVASAFSFANQALPPDFSTSDSKEQAVRAISPWTRQCLSDVANMVLERCFSSHIPATRHELEDFRSTTNVLLEFESQLFELCPASASDAARRPIHAAVSHLDELFVKRRCDLAQRRARELAEDPSFVAFELEQHQVWSLDLVRDLVATSDCDTSPLLAKAAEQVASQHSSSAPGGAMVFPRCAISRAVHELVLEVYNLVNEAALSSDSPSQLSLLLSTARLVLDLFRALYPTLHRAQLARIPALAWQFFNDCLYASHHAGVVAHLVSLLIANTAGDIESSDAWLETARLFLRTGSTHVESVVTREASELKALVAGCSDAFYDAANETAKAQLAKSRKQVHLALTQLARALQPPVVTPHIFYQTIGHFIDAACEATIEAIVGIRDIGVDDSKALADHCRSMGAFSTLLQLDSHILAAYQNTLAVPSDMPATGVEADELLLSDSETGTPTFGSRCPYNGRDIATSAASARLAKGYCQLASKAVQLADILLISRADILARRRAGLLAQFTTEEL